MRQAQAGESKSPLTLALSPEGRGEGTKQKSLTNSCPKSVIFFYQSGGASHLDMVDMKPQAVPEVRGPFSPIDTKVPGLSVCDLMPGHAAIADKLTVIRSISHHLSVHDDATHWLQTGYPLLNARQQGQQHPSQGSIVSALKGSNVPGMPPYVCIPEDYRKHLGFYEHAAFISSRHNALDAGGVRVSATTPRRASLFPPPSRCRDSKTGASCIGIWTVSHGESMRVSNTVRSTTCSGRRWNSRRDRPRGKRSI